MARSPRGLIENRPAEPGPKDHFIFEATDRPGEYAIKRGWDVRPEIDTLLQFWEQWAKAHFEGREKRARDGTFDRTAAALKVFMTAGIIKTYMVDLDRVVDPSARNIAYEIIYHALLGWTEVHQLTIIDNERDIVHGRGVGLGLAKKRAKVNADRHRQRCREHKKWNDEAGKIWRTNPKLSRAAVAKSVQARLQLSEQLGTIAKKLKKPGMSC